MGVLSADELDPVLILPPFMAMGVEAFLGLDDPKPTGVRNEETRPPPDLMLEVLRTEDAPR